jgi:hypothetical protein
MKQKNLWFYKKPLGRSHWKLVTAMAAERLTMDHSVFAGWN